MDFRNKLKAAIEHAEKKIRETTAGEDLQVDLDAETMAREMIEEGCSEDTIDSIQGDDFFLPGIDDETVSAFKDLVVQFLKESCPRPARNQLINSSQGDSNAQKSQGKKGLMPQFKLKWSRIYDLKNENFFKKGKRPGPKLRVKLVREVVDQVRKKVPNPNRAFMETVYDMLAEKYPSCFHEKLADGTPTKGIILKRLKDGLDNAKRPHRNSHRRDQTDAEYQMPNIKAAYGCVAWRIKKTPAGYTEQQLQEVQESLKKTFHEVRRKRWDMDDIKQKMAMTYKNQRDMINQNAEEVLRQQKKNRYSKKKQTQEAEDRAEDVDDPEETHTPVTVTDVKREWPFLFQYPVMAQHFETLTKANPGSLLQYLEQEGKDVIEYFKVLKKRSSTTTKVYKSTFIRMKKAIRSGHNEEEATLKAVIIMTFHHMGENYKDLIQLNDEVNGTQELPFESMFEYPGLTAEGKTLFEATKFHLTADKQRVCSSKSFTEAISMVFFLYYIFNMDYNPNTPATLEYLQRFAFSIDPQRGHKRPTARGRPTTIKHPKVLNLIKCIRDHKADLTSSESSGSS